MSELDSEAEVAPIAAGGREFAERVRRALPTAPPALAKVAAAPAAHGLIVVAVVLVLVSNWGLASYNSYVAELVAVYAIAALGLNIPAGFGGALSLGQGAAFSLGAYATAVVVGKHGWPVWASLPLALAFGAVVGALMGAPAGRLGVIGLAMTSLGLTLVVADVIVGAHSLTGGQNGIGNIVPSGSFGGHAFASDWVLPGVIFGCLYVAYVLHSRYRLSRIGRASLAIRDEPLGASAIGISPYWIRVIGFSAGAALGALAGALFSYQSTFLSPDSLSPSLSILFLVMVILGGAGSRIGPIFGAVILGILPLHLAKYPHVNSFVYGGLLVLLVLFRPRGLVGRTAAPTRDPFARLPATPVAGVAEDARKPRQSPARARLVLELRGVGRSFRGVVALDGVDLTVEAGQVLGLIGPNGSGKTTLLNVISGLYPADSGSVDLLGESLLGLSPPRIANRGVGRTFQTPKAFPGLSVAEHLVAAGEHRTATVDPEAERAALLATQELMRAGGLDPSDPSAMQRQSRGLAHGQLRFLEIAMAVYRVPRLLLLDEPAAGLAASEIERLEQVVRRLADDGMAVIIVEHHLDMVSRLVDQVAVLNLGTRLWTGPPDQLHAADEVRAVYLGSSV